MTSSSANKQLFIDKEALASLAMVQEGILFPVDGLMDQATAHDVDGTGLYKGQTFPFSFLLAPSGRRNHEVLSQAKPGDILELIENNQRCGTLTVKEVFPIDPLARVEKIFGTRDPSHLGVENTLRRLGTLAVCGDFDVTFDQISQAKNLITEAKTAIGAKHTTGIVMTAKPLNRAHERLLRLTLDKSDLIVVFLIRNYAKETIPYDLRKESLTYLLDTYFPRNRIVIVPLEKTYIFAGINEVILDSIVLQNYGCDQFVIGREHTGLGMYYEESSMKSIFDTLKGITIDIHISSNFVYCDKCNTLVSTTTCPHGQHHHISYHSQSILELIYAGILPPNILVRKEISAMYLSHLYPHRFKKLERLWADLIPGTGLIENHTEKEFYVQLAKLYQTTSLT